MELTLKYYHYFDDRGNELGNCLNVPESWDILRIKGEGSGNFFYISDDRTVWQQGCLSNERLKLRAQKIAGFLKLNFRCIYSFGVGDARLEFLIKEENPLFQMKCSDFAPKGLERLQNVFVEADEIFLFDITQGNWNRIDPEGICLFHRVDTELNDDQWRVVLRKMKSRGIRNVLFIPGQMVTLGRILQQEIKYIIFRLLGRKMTFSGFMRTKGKFISLLTEFFDIDQIVTLQDLQGFLLTLKEET
jgi:hypothetical protein